VTHAAVLATITQAVALPALAVVIGGLALAALMPPGLKELAAARTLLWQWVIAAAAVVLLTSAAELVTRSLAMTGGTLATALAAVPTVLARTHFGRIWIARGLLLAALLLGIARARRALPVSLAAAVALTTSLTGHAADRGDVSLAVAVDWLHVLAASAWTGGLVCLG
jgi:putative copper export protein